MAQNNNSKSTQKPVPFIDNGKDSEAFTDYLSARQTKSFDSPPRITKQQPDPPKRKK